MQRRGDAKNRAASATAVRAAVPRQKPEKTPAWSGRFRAT